MTTSVYRVSRLPAVGLFATGVTIGLFLLMEFLIRSDGAQLDTRVFTPITEILPRIVETPPEKRTKPEPLPKPIAPPPTPTLLPDFEGAATGFTIITPPEKTGVIEHTMHRLVDGTAKTVVAVTPRYPVSAATKGIEGHVLLEFTVTPAGSVTDVEVLDAQPPGIFDRSAVSAVKRYKYKPKVVGGKAVPQPGVKTRIVYELDD